MHPHTLISPLKCFTLVSFDWDSVQPYQEAHHVNGHACYKFSVVVFSFLFCRVLVFFFFCTVFISYFRCYIILDFSLTVKAATLIFISGHGSAIS